jgi:hypothetical protein
MAVYIAVTHRGFACYAAVPARGTPTAAGARRTAASPSPRGSTRSGIDTASSPCGTTLTRWSSTNWSDMSARVSTWLCENRRWRRAVRRHYISAHAHVRQRPALRSATADGSWRHPSRHMDLCIKLQRARPRRPTPTHPVVALPSSVTNSDANEVPLARRGYRHPPFGTVPSTVGAAINSWALTKPRELLLSGTIQVDETGEHGENKTWRTLSQ